MPTRAHIEVEKHFTIGWGQHMEADGQDYWMGYAQVGQSAHGAVAHEAIGVQNSFNHSLVQNPYTGTVTMLQHDLA